VAARLRRSPPGPLDYTRRLWLQAVVGLTLLFLYAPIAILILFSFNDSRRTVVWRGFTTDWYVAAWTNDRLFEAFTNSLVIAFLATILSVVIGTTLAIALWRFRFPAKPAFEGLVALPIVIPEICMGVAMMVFFARVDWPTDLPWPLNLGSITIAHTAFCFPFTALVVRARMAGFDRSLEEAAKDLGAGEWQAFRDVILPYLRPGMVAGGLLAFTLSLDDFVITFFTAGPETVTFPVQVFSMVRFSVTPEVNAASTALIVITVVLTVLAMTLQSPVRRADRAERSPSG
jgi:spermidine/putrescine transport system permease protein